MIKTSLNSAPQRLIIGISGASGVVFGVRLLELLKDSPIETHLVMSKSAEMTLISEMNMKAREVVELADQHHVVTNVGASIASGSFPTSGMIIAPCSMRTLGEIATGITSSLLTRAADVVLKERRRLVLMVRETPLHSGHLRQMLTASESGAIIAPPVPAFYAQPKTLDDMITHNVIRVLDLFGITLDANATIKRWGIDVGVKAP